MEITLTLTLEEVNLIQSALVELPFKVSAELIGKIKEQGEKQFQEQQMKVAE